MDKPLCITDDVILNAANDAIQNQKAIPNISEWKVNPFLLLPSLPDTKEAKIDESVEFNEEQASKRRRTERLSSTQASRSPGDAPAINMASAAKLYIASALDRQRKVLNPKPVSNVKKAATKRPPAKKVNEEALKSALENGVIVHANKVSEKARCLMCNVDIPDK